MEWICTRCGALSLPRDPKERCPACGGEFVERASLSSSGPHSETPPEVDHRGIVLPRRHALGGIITPQ